MKPLLVAAFMALATVTSAQPKGNPMFYRLMAHFNPDSSLMEGKAEILDPSDSCFYLSSGLKINAILADGESVSAHVKAKDEVNGTILYQLNRIPNRLIVNYSGKLNADNLPKPVSLLNGINSKWIELSERIDWVPRMARNGAYTYEMDVVVPESFTTITGTKLLKTISTDAHLVTRWKSTNPVGSITLLSAPGLKKSATIRNGVDLEIYYTDLPQTYIDSMKTDLLKSVELLNQMFGPLGKSCEVKIAYSPRSAGGYARRPLLMVSEKYALDQRKLNFGYARDFKLNTHEIAHYWSFADTGAPEDWMNEGLAEYASFLISEKLIGKGFANLLTSEYEGIVNHTQTATAIAETPGDSWEREINRYYKPTMLFNQLRQKYGEEKLNLFFRTLCGRMKAADKRSTGLFLEVMEQTVGKEARDFFAEAIYRKGWDVEVTSANNSGQIDPAFVGTWSGPLTQFGSTAQFVLNLVLKEGKLEPTLGSPDQNVSNIPVTEMLIQGDAISFRVSIASAVYKGTLNRETHVIQGVWTQRGADYPLTITRENQ